jgi:hypothetical protein
MVERLINTKAVRGGATTMNSEAVDLPSRISGSAS